MGWFQSPGPREISSRENSDKYEISNSAISIFIIVLIGLVVAASCIGESFNYVEYHQYGLLKHKYSGVRLSKVYEQGRYFFPLSYELLVFPATYKTVEFGAYVFSDDGLEFRVDVRFEYRVPIDQVGKIYDQFSLNYHNLIVSTAQTTIKGVAAPLNINDYLDNRTYVQDVFANAVIEELRETVPVYVPSRLFYVEDVELPTSIIERSLQSNVAVQRNEILQNTQAIAVTRAETSRLVAEIDGERTKTLSNAVIQSNLLKKSASTFAKQVEIKAKGEGLAYLFDYLNYTTLDAPNKTMTLVSRLAQIDAASTIKYVTLSQSAFDLEMNV